MSNWPEFEAQLHPYVKQRLIGRFSADVASVSNEEIRDRADALLKRWIKERAHAKAERSARLRQGATAAVSPDCGEFCRRSKTGEVQSIFLGENYSAQAVECPHCGHLDAHLIQACVACGHATRELADVCDAIIPIAIRRDIELFYLKEHEGLDRAGNIAALLRFRSDQRTGQVAAAS